MQKKKKSKVKHYHLEHHAAKAAVSGTLSTAKVKSTDLAGEIVSYDEIKMEIRKNVIYMGIFLVLLISIYILVDKTNFLDQVLAIFGLNGVY